MSQSYPDVPLFIGSFPQTVQALDGNEYAVISTPEGCYNGLGSSYVGVKTDDINLVSGNIKKGTSIFGVSGTFTSDANATAAYILSGKTAYVNGSKVTGTMPNQSASIRTITTDTGNQTLGCFRYYSNYLQIIPGKGYWGSWSWDTSRLQIAQSVLASAIGLTAAKIARGNTILGIAGTYTGSGDSGGYLYLGIRNGAMSGYAFGTASYSNGIRIGTTGSYRIVLFGYNEAGYSGYLRVNGTNKLTIDSLREAAVKQTVLTLSAGNVVTIAASGGVNYGLTGFVYST